VIENRSGRTVIAYVFKTADENGQGSFYQQLLATSMQPAGIPDGGSLYARGAMPLNPTVPMQSPVQIVSPDQRQVVTATLKSVILTMANLWGWMSIEPLSHSLRN
jgi:hypothetical protein